jgi:predicted GNAT family acetyltransferase
VVNILNELQKQYPQVIFELRYGFNTIELNRFIIPKELRKQGIGTQFMKALIQFANINQSLIVLTPSDSFGATSITRLKRFYKRFGFVENRGRNANYQLSCGMYKIFK